MRRFSVACFVFLSAVVLLASVGGVQAAPDRFVQRARGATTRRYSSARQAMT
jgi:hypothetical protein